MSDTTLAGVGILVEKKAPRDGPGAKGSSRKLVQGGRAWTNALAVIGGEVDLCGASL